MLVTSALPYANGPIHLGHVLEYVQADIWVRFQKLLGNRCIFVCADDTHGTPVMLRARQEGIEPEVLIERVAGEHRRDLAEFRIGFDNFYTTHSAENRELVETIFKRLDAGGHIVRRNVRQAYDEREQMFLPDRFVRGTCPVCGTPGQYGDSCENCGATYSPGDLIDPVSVLSDTPPVQRESEHLFFKLGDFREMLDDWVHGSRLHQSVTRKLEEWFREGLRDWDISRDAPYFGFEIPGAPGKYFYVWLDAPVGYMASFMDLCKRSTDLEFDAFWGRDSKAELYHFIGKDIIYFHALFWPAVLTAAGFRTPTAVYAHGFLTVDSQKMSKSRGTFITARAYLDHLQPDYLRYYFAAKLGPGIDDIDLRLEDFVLRVNADLVGKLVNIASRCAGLLGKRFDGRLAAALDAPELHSEFVEAGQSIAQRYDEREYGRAIREIMALADRANQYIDERKPWVLARDPAESGAVHEVCTTGINLFRVLLIYLKPVVPDLAERAETFLNNEVVHWDDSRQPLLHHQLKEFRPLLMRVDDEAVAAVLAAAREEVAGQPVS
ncbi:MAG: methionine--tRNA ligase [Gammaproteobacteria bacterium]